MAGAFTRVSTALGSAVPVDSANGNVSPDSPSSTGRFTPLSRTAPGLVRRWRVHESRQCVTGQPCARSGELHRRVLESRSRRPRSRSGLEWRNSVCRWQFLHRRGPDSKPNGRTGRVHGSSDRLESERHGNGRSDDRGERLDALCRWRLQRHRWAVAQLYRGIQVLHELGLLDRFSHHFLLEFGPFTPTRAVGVEPVDSSHSWGARGGVLGTRRRTRPGARRAGHVRSASRGAPGRLRDGVRLRGPDQRRRLRPDGRRVQPRRGRLRRRSASRLGRSSTRARAGCSTATPPAPRAPAGRSPLARSARRDPGVGGDRPDGGRRRWREPRVRRSPCSISNIPESFSSDGRVRSCRAFARADRPLVWTGIALVSGARRGPRRPAPRRRLERRAQAGTQAFAGGAIPEPCSQTEMMPDGLSSGQRQVDRDRTGDRARLRARRCADHDRASR